METALTHSSTACCTSANNSEPWWPPCHIPCCHMRRECPVGHPRCAGMSRPHMLTIPTAAEPLQRLGVWVRSAAAPPPSPAHLSFALGALQRWEWHQGVPQNCTCSSPRNLMSTMRAVGHNNRGRAWCLARCTPALLFCEVPL